ncbi:hypothetical protein AAFF_G00300410 [Aldrovandia affinis]|uniref:Uncharacterized protein n=1 Tax=Aldrovandia affinis TaxID=143900 RepID=A0AAD7WRD7_9TELE|nr:hypothetical protein AAFF_G00300410 [Aldrovandia affinis]
MACCHISRFRQSTVPKPPAANFTQQAPHIPGLTGLQSKATLHSALQRLQARPRGLVGKRGAGGGTAASLLAARQQLSKHAPRKQQTAERNANPNASLPWGLVHNRLAVSSSPHPPEVTPPVQQEQQRRSPDASDLSHPHVLLKLHRIGGGGLACHVPLQTGVPLAPGKDGDRPGPPGHHGRMLECSGDSEKEKPSRADCLRSVLSLPILSPAPRLASLMTQSLCL